jgi:uridine phosphorylase
VDGIASLEVRIPQSSYVSFHSREQMETFHLLHLAASWSKAAPSGESPSSEPSNSPTAPVHHLPVAPSVTAPHKTSTHTLHKPVPSSTIRAAAAQIIFAGRLSQDFITPDHVREIEVWTGKAVLEALNKFDIETEVSLLSFLSLLLKS